MPELADRSGNLARRDKIAAALRKLYADIQKSFEASQDRGTAIDQNWKLYNCELTHKQLYNGRNELFLPLVYEACQARATRFTNQLFPRSGRHVECVSEDGTFPRAVIAVCEHYIDQANLRQVISALSVTGDIEGQYNLYCSWKEATRHPVRRLPLPVNVEGYDAADVEDIVEEDELLGGPHAEIISDRDVSIYPVTSDGPDDAIGQGGAVTILRRWTKAKVREMIDSQEIDKTVGREVLVDMDKVENGVYRSLPRELANAAGIKKGAESTWLLVYEIWTELEIAPDTRRLCQVYMASKSRILMCRRNPLWCDKLPLLSVPVERMPGVAKGIAPISQVAPMQYYATDVLNQTADSATYSLVPIIFRDPAMNTSPLTLAPGAVWDVAPANVQFAEFPPIYKEGLELLESLKQQVFQVLTVNPAAISQLTSRKKLNAAEVAQEQQIDILTTADAVGVLEDGILSPLVALFMDLDYQYRRRDLTVRQYGEMGMQANLEQIPPLHEGTRYAFRWSGVEVTRSQQQMQQKIAALNVIRAIPPQAYPTKTLDLDPIITDLVESVYGTQQGRLVLKDLRSQLSVDPEQENVLLMAGHWVPTHPMDNHQEHVTVHQRSIEIEGDPFQNKMTHVREHQIMMMLAQQAQMQKMLPQQGGQQQGGGGGQPGPQMQGPRAGAQPGQPRPGQQPPGMIGQDQLRDPTVFPRRAG